MQYAGNTALAAAVIAPVRNPSASVQFDWDNTGLFTNTYSDLSDAVDSVTLDKQLQGDLPSALTMLEGYATAQLTVVLAGTHDDGSVLGQSVTALLSRYNTASPLYRKTLIGSRVRYSVILGGVTVQQFFGEVTDVVVARKAGTVTITCLDLSNLVQAGVMFPPWSIDASTCTASQAIGQDPPLLNSAWAVDFVCRRNQFYNGPPPHPNATISATMAGGLIPEIGTTVWNSALWGGAPSGSSYFDQSQLWTAGQYGLCLDTTSGVRPRMLCDSTTPLQIDQGLSNLPVIGIGMWINMVSAPTTTASLTRLYLDKTVNAAYQVAVNLAPTGVSLTVTGPSYSQTTPVHAISIGAWHYVAVALSFVPSQVSARWYIDGTESPTSDLLSSSGYPAVGTKLVNGFLDLNPPSGAPVKAQHLQVWYNTGLGNGAGKQTWPMAPNPAYGVTDIGLGANWLYFLPDVDSANSWTTLQDITNAELAVLVADEWGTIRFRSRAAMQAQYQLGATVGTLSSDVLLDLEESSGTDRVRNIITYSTQGGSNAAAAPGTGVPPPNSVAWQSDNAQLFPVQANSTYSWQIPISQSFTEITGTTLTFIGATIPPNTTGVNSGYTVCNANTGANITSGVTVFVQPAPGGRAFTMTISNSNSVPILLAYTASGQTSVTPCLIVPGWPLILDSAVTNQVADTVSRQAYGDLSYPITSNTWSQHPGAIGAVAQSLLRDLRAPIPQLPSAPITGDPRMQLGDTYITADAPYSSGAIATVAGFTRTFDSSGLVDTPTWRLRIMPGAWTLNETGHSTLASTPAAATTWLMQ